MVKRFSAVIFIMIGWLSCSSPASHDRSPADSAIKPADSSGRKPMDSPDPKLVAAESHPLIVHPLDTLVPFSGVWVNDVYIRNILRNRSPRRSQNVQQSCITIPPRTLQITRMVGGFHEGAADMVVVKEGDRYEFLSADLTSFMYGIRVISEDRIGIGDQTFSRLVPADTTKVDWGILEALLFSGNYRDAYGQPVHLGADGQISGMDTLRYYVPVIDYADGPNQIDHIQLGSSPRRMEDYGFRFDKDSLILYTVECLEYSAGEKQCVSERLGYRMYTLIREHE
jgi:hypothetical protein